MAYLHCSVHTMIPTIGKLQLAQPRFWNIVPCLYASEGVHPQFPPTCSLTSSFQQLCQPTAWLLPSSSHSTILKSFFPAVVEASLHRPLCMTQHRIKQLQEGEKKKIKNEASTIQFLEKLLCLFSPLLKMASTLIITSNCAISGSEVKAGFVVFKQ